MINLIFLKVKKTSKESEISKLKPGDDIVIDENPFKISELELSLLELRSLGETKVLTLKDLTNEEIRRRVFFDPSSETFKSLQLGNEIHLVDINQMTETTVSFVDSEKENESWYDHVY